MMKIISKIYCKISPTFRMLSGNRHRMNILLEKIENLERINRSQELAILDVYKRQSDIFLEKLDNLEKLSKQHNEHQKNRTNFLNISIQKLNKCKCETIVHEKKKAKILFVAMLDSIHTARWLMQFADCEKYEIHLFSVSSGKPHPLILNELEFSIHECDFFGEDIQQSDASDVIEDIINFIKPDIVHTLEMQHSAYLVLPIKKKMLKKFPLWFYSCWGSDIKWFERFPEHKSKIVEVLDNCDALFSGDKQSIHKAIDEYGFKKPTLNVPSPGGYRVDYYMSKFRIAPSIERNIILVKGYNGWVYKPEVVFEALKKCKDEIIKNKLKVVIFLGGDIQNYIDEIKNLGIEVEVFEHTDNYDDMMELYSKAKLSLASSLSDGVPNSMLESMLMGCFPILSNRGSAEEYINNGVNGCLLDPDDVDGYASAIKKAIMDNELLNNAMKINREIIKERLDFYKIREIVLSFYDKFI